MTEDGKGRAPVVAALRRALGRSRQWVILATCSALAACAVLGSESLETLSNRDAQPVGVSYALPMGLIDVTLSVNQQLAEYRIEIMANFIPDPTRRYLMQYHPLPNYKDIVEIRVHSNSLLDEIDSNTEDQTDDIILELAKTARSLGGFQSALVPDGFSMLANITIDPTDDEQVGRAAAFLSSKVRSFAKSKYSVACGGADAKSSECRRYRNYARAGVDFVDLGVEHPPAVAVTTTPVDCTAGLCYRAKEPYLIKFAIDGVKRVKLVELPNKAPLVEIDITRAFFVQKIQKIKFDRYGFLWKANVKKDSEIKAVAALPIAVITAIGDVLPLRLKIMQKQNDLAEQRLAELEAQEQLRQAKKEHN